MTRDGADRLAEAAALARAWAPQRCCEGRNGEPGCAPYHGAWPTLRWLGSITGAYTDRSFFEDQLAALPTALREPRVLIAGAADHALLDIALRSLHTAGREARFTVADACRTPLDLNLWHAAAEGVAIDTWQGDLRQLPASGRYDVVLVHSVLSFVPESDRAALFNVWHQALAAGGRLLLVQGVRPHHAGPPLLRLSADEVERFVERVLADAARSDEASRPPDEDLRALALAFARHKTLHVVRAPDGISDGLRRVGFELQRADLVDRHGTAYRASNADADDRAFSLRIVASKAG